MFMWIAPFFMVYEVMHMITKYRDEDLKEAKWEIEADIAHYRLEKGYPMRPNIKLAGKDWKNNGSKIKRGYIKKDKN